MAISSFDTEEPPSPVHHGFSERIFLFDSYTAKPIMQRNGDPKNG